MTTRTRPPKPGPGYVWSEALWDWVPPGLGENVPQGQVEPPVEPEIDPNWWRGMASAAAEEEEKKQTPEKPPIAPSNITVPPGMQYVGTNEFGAPEFMPLTEKLTPPPGTKLVGKNEFGGEEFLPELPPQPPIQGDVQRRNQILFDIMKDVLPDMTVSYGMSPQQAADVAVNNLTSYMQEQPDQFIAAIQEKGWNPNTEALLLGVGFKWEQLKKIFPSIFEDEDVKNARKLSLEAPEQFIDMLRTTDRAKAEDLLIRMGATREQIDAILPPVAPVKLPTLSWLDKVNEIKNDPAKLVPFLSSGKEIVDLGRLLKIATDYEAGKDLNKEDYLSLKAYVDKAQQDTDWTYKVADILGQLPAFAGEFVATGGIFAAGQKIGIKAGTEALKRLLTKVGIKALEGKLAQFGIKLAGVAAGGTLRTIPAGITRIPAATLEKQLQALTITGDEESVFTSAVKALGEQWVEIVSESTGGLFPSLSKVAKGALIKAGLIKAIQKANTGADVSDIQKVVKALGYNGVFEEMLEERVADVGHGVLAAIGLGDQPFKLPSIQQLGIELAAFSVPGVAIKIAEGIPAAIEEGRLRPERGSIGKVPSENILPLGEISKYETRIPLDLIRKDEPETIARLTEEIKRDGIKEPIVIRIREDGSRIVWDGIHRLIAAQDLGIKDIPVRYIGGETQKGVKPPKVPPTLPIPKDVVAIPEAVTPTAPAVEVPQIEIPTEAAKPPVAQPAKVEVPPVEPPEPPQSVVPPSIPEPTPEAPRDREIRRIVTQSEEQVKQDAPKALTRLLLHIPGLRQVLTFERPGLKMTGENQKVLTAMVAEQAARSDVSVWAMSSRLNLLKDIRKVFGEEALHGGKVNIDFFGTDEQAKNPITKTLKDIADNPELYRLTENQKGILSLMEIRNNQLLDWVTENYGAEIGKFVPKENGAFLPNVDISEDVIEYLGSETRAAATGRGKTRVWQTARERMAGKTPFTPELDVQKLIEGLDVFKASAAAGQTYRQAIGGLTRLEAMEKTHPALYDKMTALRKRLSSLQGSAGTIESNVHKAIFEFLNSPSEGTDLLTLHEQLDVKLKTGVRKGMDVEAIQDEIVKVRQGIADIRPAWEAANLKPYAFIKEGLFRYFPAEQAKLIIESRKTTDNHFLKFVERWRGGAFSGDISPFAIQGHVGVLANPFGSLKAGAGAIQSAVEHHDLLRSVNIEALADDIANNPKEWGEFASLMGRTLSGTPQEYAAGFFSKLPGFDKFTESTYITVTRGSFNLWQQTYKRLVKSGLSELEAKVAAAKVAGEVFPLVNTSLLGQSQARHAFLRAIPTSYSFIRQPVTLITDATRAFAKVATFQKLTPGESLAARTIFTMATTTLIVSATSAAIEAIKDGGDDDKIRKAIWDAINPDPYNGNFASLIIAGKRIPLGGPYRAIFRAIYPQEVKGVPFPVPFYGLLHPNERTGMPEGFMWNRISPAIKTQLELIANKDYFGGQIVKGTLPEKILRFLEYEFESALPLSVGEAAEAARLGERYKEDVWQQVISQFMGVNMVTLDNTFIDRQIRQLGLPDPNVEAKPYSIQKPKVFDTSDLWGDVSRVLSARTKEEGYDDKPITKAIIEARKIKAEVDVLPNVKAISINADPKLGDTFIQFYDQWQERLKITDKEALKEFDKKYPKAEQGNMTQRTFTLLREYHSLPDKKEQAKFLESHSELSENPQQEWLKAHPKENAQLAVWGQADVLSQKAYDEAQRLIKTLGIPDSAVSDFIPPKEVAKANFDYLDAVEKFGGTSVQARLIRTDDKFNEWLKLERIDEDVKGLELKVKNYDTTKKYETLSDKDSVDYIADETKRKEAQEKFKTDNPKWVEDNDRIQARSVGTRDKPTPDETVNKWVDKGKVARESKGYDTEEKVWYLDNPEIHKWALENKLITDDGSKWNAPVLRIQVKPENRKMEAEREKLKGDDEGLKKLMATPVGKTWKDDQRRITAYQNDGTEFVESWVEHGKVSDEFGGSSAESKVWLYDHHKEWTWALGKKLLSDEGQDWNIPVLRLNVKWRKQDTEYDTILSKYNSFQQAEQDKAVAEYLSKNPEYRTARIRRNGYELGLSEQPLIGSKTGDKPPIEKWVEYGQLPESGYYRDRYRLDNPDFDKTVKAAQLSNKKDVWEDVNPAKVPNVRYDIITEQFKDLFKQYEEADVKGKRSILAGNKDFANARMERDAYKLLIGSERYVPNYMEYYKIVNADTFGDNYEDDWYLMEHPDFYNTMRSKLGWRPRDFNKVPSREVWSAYQVYSRLTTTLDRYRMRASNSGLDNWLYLTRRVSEKIDTLKDYEQLRARGGPSEVEAYKRYLGEEKLSSSQKKFKESSAEIDTLLESLKKKLVGVK